MRRYYFLITASLIISNLIFPESKIKSKNPDSNQHTNIPFIQSQFEEKFGSGWEFYWNANQTPHRIFGKSIPQKFNAENPELSEQYAREFISQNPALFNISESEIELWVNEQHGNLRYLIFNQVFQGIPVYNARVDFRYRKNGEMVMIGHDAFPNISLNTAVSVSSKQAILFSQVELDFEADNDDQLLAEPEKFIWVENEENPVFHLAWQVELFIHVQQPEDEELPVHHWKVFVDAHSGDILEKYDFARSAIVEGQVTGGVKDEPYGSETSRGMPHVEISVSGVGSTYTDEDGYYSIDIGNSSHTATVKLEGRWLNANNQNGSDASFSRTISPGTTENFDFTNFNSIAGERDTYYHANIVHDLAKSIHSDFNGIDYEMTARVNIGSEDYYWPCNAYWDGSSINLFSSGGGCAATDQMADVVYHEYGHGIQQYIYSPYSPPYSSSGLSEGCSDYWGMTLTNTPCLGNGFFGQGTCLRNGENNLQYPASSCGGQVHCLGEYIMGSLWKMRENLIALHGYEVGVDIGDDIFYWAQTGRPNNDPDFLTEILLADDDDGSLENGTPNYMPICEGFEAHNLDCPYDGPFAELSVNTTSLEFFLEQNQTDAAEILLSNVGQAGSILTFNTGTSPFGNIGGGPDDYTTFWSDSDIEESLPYNWVEIDGMGTPYSFPHNDQAGSSVDIGFEFPFMGSSYSQCIINANGWVGFGSDNSEWDNLSIPSSTAPGPAILGLWDDLNPVNDNCNSYCSGEVYHYNDGEKFVVWFDNVAHWWTNFEDSYYDFQFVLYPNGDLELNYRSLTGSVDATVGIQNGNGSNGLEVSFDDNYLHDNLSVKFAKGGDWITMTPPNGQVSEGSTQTVIVEVNSEGMDDGEYISFINFVTSGGNYGLPVNMTVSGNVVPGDVTGDDIVNILDIVNLVNFIMGIDDPENWQFNAGDLNDDGILNILDIINMVNIIIGN